MKDAYSFDIDEESMQKAYDLMYETYNKIFTRLGLRFRAVWADSGAIGGDMSQEFHVLAESGEDCIAYCEESEYAANIEKATAQVTPRPTDVSSNAMEKVHTPGQRTIADVATFLKKSGSRER